MKVRIISKNNGIVVKENVVRLDKAEEGTELIFKDGSQLMVSQDYKVSVVI